MSKYFRLPICIVILIFTCSIFAAQDTVKVRVAEFAPYYYKDEQNKWQGLLVDIVTHILNDAGYTPEFIHLPWSRGMRDIKQGNIHIMMNLTKTAERTEYLHFVGPITEEQLHLITIKENISIPINNLDDIINLCQENRFLFGYQSDVFYSNELNDNLKNDDTFKACFLQEYQIGIHFNNTLNKRIFGFFESPLSAAHKIKFEKEFNNLTVHPFYLKRPKDQIHSYFGLSKAGVSDEMHNKITEAFENAFHNGSIEGIESEWNNKYDYSPSR